MSGCQHLLLALGLIFAGIILAGLLVPFKVHTSVGEEGE